jgi:hypothetical protein
VDERARGVLDAHWTRHGYCVPNPGAYPWQWLWDSCFHAVVWVHLGDERGVTEVASALSAIDEDGFVPHMRYPGDPGFHAEFWGRASVSSITQPPMYGHAIAEMARLGLDPGGEVVDGAARGLGFLLRRRARTEEGLVTVCHPWETGCDDSPRWDRWRPRSTAEEWFALKGALVRAIERTSGGAPLRNPDFVAAPSGFNALVAFNARELGAAMGDDRLSAEADELAEAIDARWDGRTWVDGGDAEGTSGRVETLDALLPALLGGPHTGAALDALTDPDRFAAPHGPRGVSREEAVYEPRGYWRGPAWPQLSYLSWLAATAAGSAAAASSLAAGLVSGALESGWSEYWDPDTGDGLGASPQSWTSLAAVVAKDHVEPRRA